jgi:hypothetical protein
MRLRQRHARRHQSWRCPRNPPLAPTPGGALCSARASGTSEPNASLSTPHGVLSRPTLQTSWEGVKRCRSFLGLQFAGGSVASRSSAQSPRARLSYSSACSDSGLYRRAHGHRVRIPPQRQRGAGPRSCTPPRRRSSRRAAIREYLHKVLNGSCGIAGTGMAGPSGLAMPAPAGAAQASADWVRSRGPRSGPPASRRSPGRGRSSGPTQPRPGG